DQLAMLVTGKRADVRAGHSARAKTGVIYSLAGSGGRVVTKDKGRCQSSGTDLQCTSPGNLSIGHVASQPFQMNRTRMKTEITDFHRSDHFRLIRENP